ncbi:MAG: hypothetical protein ACR2J8_06560, partial [Thermomicrobiales bacterium]
MDYLVIGIGTGALALLAGLLLRERGAFWRPGTGRPADLAADHAARVWGRAVAAAGALMLIVTVALLL